MYTPHYQRRRVFYIPCSDQLSVLRTETLYVLTVSMTAPEALVSHECEHLVATVWNALWKRKIWTHGGSAFVLWSRQYTFYMDFLWTDSSKRFSILPQLFIWGLLDDVLPTMYSSTDMNLPSCWLCTTSNNNKNACLHLKRFAILWICSEKLAGQRRKRLLEVYRTSVFSRLVVQTVLPQCYNKCISKRGLAQQ